MPTRRRSPVAVRLDWDISVSVTATDVASLIVLEPIQPRFKAILTDPKKVTPLTEGAGKTDLSEGSGSTPKL